MQVTDGVAGSSNPNLYFKYKDMNGDLQKPKPFIGNYNLGKTGFGLLTVDLDTIQYRHIAVSTDETD